MAASARYERMLNDLQSQPGNNICADCKRHNPRWASHNLGIFLCVTCASVHRKIGTHITKVKSLDQDIWTKEQVENMKVTGNTKSNLKYNPDERRHPPPANLETTDRGSELENFIRMKYEKKAYMGATPSSSTPAPTSSQPQPNRPSSASASSTLSISSPPRAKSTPAVNITAPPPSSHSSIPPVPAIPPSSLGPGAGMSTAPSAFSMGVSRSSTLPPLSYNPQSQVQPQTRFSSLSQQPPPVPQNSPQKLGVSGSTLNDMLSISNATFSPAQFSSLQQHSQTPMDISPHMGTSNLPQSQLQPQLQLQMPMQTGQMGVMNTNPFPLSSTPTGLSLGGGAYSASPISPIGHGLPSSVSQLQMQGQGSPFRSSSLPVPLGTPQMQMQMGMNPQLTGFGVQPAYTGLGQMNTGLSPIGYGVGTPSPGIGTATLQSPFGAPSLANTSPFAQMSSLPQNPSPRHSPMNAGSNNPFLQQPTGPTMAPPSPFGGGGGMMGGMGGQMPMFTGASATSPFGQPQQQQQQFGGGVGYGGYGGGYGGGGWGGT